MASSPPAIHNGRVIEVEGVETSKIENFPLSGLKVVGAVQIAFGGASMLLGLIDVLMFVFQEEDSMPLPSANPSNPTASAELKSARATLVSLTISSSPIWCGLWFCVAGAMAACMSEKNKTTLGYFKLTFLVLSILNSSVFAPICLITASLVTVYRHLLQAGTFRWLIPLLIAFFAFHEIVFAIVSAAICCCCSPLRNNRVRVLVATANDYDSMFPPEKDPEEIPKPKKPKKVNNKDQPQNNQMEPEIYPQEPEKLPLPPLIGQRPPTQGSLTSFARLKKLALPSNEQLTTF